MLTEVLQALDWLGIFPMISLGASIFLARLLYKAFTRGGVGYRDYRDGDYYDRWGDYERRQDIAGGSGD